MHGLATLAANFGKGELRLTIWQNVIIPHVPNALVASACRQLKNQGFTTEASSTTSGIVACTGSRGCKYAAADTTGAAASLAKHLDHSNLAVEQPVNLHFTGLNDLYFGNGRADEHYGKTDRSWKAIRAAHLTALRKFVPYYLKNYLFFPALAGLMFWNIWMFGKVLLGNWMAETLRDIYSAATIYCGHTGEDVADFPEGTRAKGKGEWYAMQVAATNNFEVCLPLSILCGGLDRQIEHHLFPKLPPDRLRKIAPEVRAVCAAHGVPYRTDTWWRTLKKALAHMRNLSVCELGRAAV